MHNCRLENPISYIFMGCVCDFVCTYIQMTEVDIGYLPQLCSKLSGLESLSLNVELQILLDWQARDPIICFLSAGIIGMPLLTSTFTYSFWGSFFPLYIRFMGIKSRSSWPVLYRLNFFSSPLSFKSLSGKKIHRLIYYYG